MVCVLSIEKFSDARTRSVHELYPTKPVASVYKFSKTAVVKNRCGSFKFVRI